LPWQVALQLMLRTHYDPDAFLAPPTILFAGLITTGLSLGRC
jgi:hypothetical protein